MMRSASPLPPVTPFSPWPGPLQLAGVLLLCVLSRVVTTIHHIEDADSLRFALGVIDYDVTRLQPQFPGYTAFMGVVKLFHALTGRYALAFSLVGGLGLFVLLHYGLALLRWRFTETRGLILGVLLVFNPMVWLLGNRYMSDLSGAACMLAAFYHLSRTDSRRHVMAGFFLTGILAGWRLSYAPFLLAPLALNLLSANGTVREALRARTAMLLTAAAGVLVWMIPLIAVTGWDALIETAHHQTSAHFLATGGTYVTENSWPLRIQRLFAHLWTDGLGAWAPDRNPVTLIVAGGALIFLARGLFGYFRDRRADFSPAGLIRAWRDNHFSPVALLTLSSAVYVLWILFFQNVIHQTRHVLPLVPPLLMILAAGLSAHTLTAARRVPLRAAALVFLLAYGITGSTLARQHMKPSAIAQAKAYVETFADTSTVIITAPWIEKCLSAQGVKARYLSVETPRDLAALPDRLSALDPATPLASVGNYTDIIHQPPTAHHIFHHNPYVNRLGSKIEVFVYGPPEPDMP